MWNGDGDVRRTTRIFGCIMMICSSVRCWEKKKKCVAGFRVKDDSDDRELAKSESNCEGKLSEFHYPSLARAIRNEIPY